MFDREANDQTSTADTDRERAGRLSRRAYLKSSAAAVVLTGATGVATASTGYGEGGFGEGGFGGGTSDTSVAVSTESPTEVGAETARLEGSLGDLGGASAADCYFEWRDATASSWTATSGQTLDSTGAFDRAVGGLASGTDYEYRAVTTASDGDSDAGETVTFTTDSGSETPAIDTLTVTEAGSPNPHAEITVDWAVSDPDGDLLSVEIAVFDAGGSRVRTVTHSVSGTDAAGADTVKIKHVGTATFDVTLTVADAAGNSASETRRVQS